MSLSAQRSYLQQAAFIAYRTPRVRGLNQFRLTDGGLAGSGARRFEEFQSGLMFRDRKRKPAYAVFPHPFVIKGDRFFGQVRRGGAHRVRVERRRRAGRSVSHGGPGAHERRRLLQLPPARPPRRATTATATTTPAGTSAIVRVRR